jgi:DNA-binding NarL/FixJ family response regulator
VIHERNRVLIADDDVLLREGIASLLERSQFEVVGLAGDVSQLIRLVADRSPDAVVLDVRMPPTYTTEGVDAARDIRARFSAIGILMLSAHVEVHRALDLLSSGQGIGYLLKNRVTNVSELVEALERVVAGGSVIDPGLVSELVAAKRVRDPLEDLTPRERDVLRLMAEGRSNAGIARQLWVTEATVHKHVQRIFQKLPLSETDDDHRRVLAVLTFLQSYSHSDSDSAESAPRGSTADR